MTPTPVTPVPPNPNLFQRLLAVFANSGITQPDVAAALVGVIGVVVAVVPKWAPEKEALIAGVPGAVAVAFLIAHGLRTLAASNPSLADMEQIVQSDVAAAVNALNLTKVATDAVDAKGLSVIVRKQVANEFQAMAQAAAAGLTHAPSPGFASGGEVPDAGSAEGVEAASKPGTRKRSS